jgi:hypothetical protein
MSGKKNGARYTSLIFRSVPEDGIPGGENTRGKNLFATYI